MLYLRWGKCKLNILELTSGGQRPGQAGNTGQLFFTKCGDPPKGCECKFEAPKGKHAIISIQYYHHCVVWFALLISIFNCDLKWYISLKSILYVVASFY